MTKLDHHTICFRRESDQIFIGESTVNVKEVVWPTDWAGDIHQMHVKYGFHAPIKNLDRDTFKEFLKFRANFIKEELNELYDSIESEDAPEIVDALIDICVVAIGTLDLCDVDLHKAWQEVLRANLNKSVGIKEGRPNPLGLPDLIKSFDWMAPNHTGNTGFITFKLGE